MGIGFIFFSFEEIFTVLFRADWKVWKAAEPKTGGKRCFALQFSTILYKYNLTTFHTLDFTRNWSRVRRTHFSLPPIYRMHRCICYNYSMLQLLAFRAFQKFASFSKVIFIAPIYEIINIIINHFIRKCTDQGNFRLDCSCQSER